MIAATRETEGYELPKQKKIGDHCLIKFSAGKGCGSLTQKEAFYCLFLATAAPAARTVRLSCQAF